MNTLFISLQKDLDTIGLKSLHYNLLHNNHNSFLLYLPQFEQNNKQHLMELERFIYKLKPGLIGISLMSIEYHKACYLTRILKGFIKSTPILWGGIHTTISPEDCLNYSDYVCIGEGERTVLDIANAIKKDESVKNINNLCYLENGRINRNPLYPLIENLDELPAYEHIPANSFILTSRKIEELDKTLFRKYSRYSGKVYSIITTRGCPFSCTYCCNNSITNLYGNSKIRKRSIGNIIKELIRAIKDNPDLEHINFQDDCFLSCSDDYLSEFCKIYKKKINKPFIIRSIPIYITRGKMESLKNAGLAWISLGLQSGSDHILKEVYQRKSLKADFLKAAGIIRDFNVAAFYDVILDNPFETENDALKTVETFIETPKPFYTQFLSLVLYPGTELHKMAKSEFSGLAEEHLKKDYFIMHKSTINNLIRLSTFIDAKYMTNFIRLYKERPESIRFKITLFTLNLLSFSIFEPMTYFKTIRLSQRGSYWKTFKILSMYFKEGFRRYISQLRTD